MARLIVSQSDGSERTIPLTDQTLRIGRSAENELRLEDESVSTFHAEIRFTGGHHVLHDLGSTNGIRHNGDRVSECPLATGDLVRIGSVRARFEADPGDLPPPPESAPAATIGQSPPPAQPPPARPPAASIPTIGFGPKSKAADPEIVAIWAVAAITAATALIALGYAFTM